MGPPRYASIRQRGGCWRERALEESLGTGHIHIDADAYIRGAYGVPHGVLVYLYLSCTSRGAREVVGSSRCGDE